MITLERTQPDQLTVISSPPPKLATGVAYFILGGLFIWMGLQEARWTSVALGVVALIFGAVTMRPVGRTLAIFDRGQGTLTLRKEVWGAKGQTSHPLSELAEVRVGSIKLLWRNGYFLLLTLRNGQDLAIQHSLDTRAEPVTEAAKAIQEFLGPQA